MVALLKDYSTADCSKAPHPSPMPSLAPRLRLAPVDDSPLGLDMERSQLASSAEPSRVQSPDSELSGASFESEQTLVTPELAIITALLILALLTFVRISQGIPPASSWDSLAPTPAVATAPGVGENIHVVDAGDTLWAIAEEIAPQADVRLVVDALAQRNGGSGLQVGQRLVIPADLGAS